MNDVQFMRRAKSLAKRGAGYVEPNPMVGCVIVCGGKVVGEGYHHRFGSAHAEVEALRQAGRKARGGTVYVTLEPCPMCAGALVLARIDRLVYGCHDPKTGSCGSLYNIVEDERLNHRIPTISGVLDEQCSGQLSGFFQKKRANSN